jgi:hypothetical protein
VSEYAIRDVPNAPADQGGTLDYAHVDGVVLSSGVLTTAGTPVAAEDETARGAGAALLRRTVAAHLRRETVVVALTSTGPRGLERWGGHSL